MGPNPVPHGPDPVREERGQLTPSRRAGGPLPRIRASGGRVGGLGATAEARHLPGWSGKRRRGRADSGHNERMKLVSVSTLLARASIVMAVYAQLLLAQHPYGGEYSRPRTPLGRRARPRDARRRAVAPTPDLRVTTHKLEAKLREQDVEAERTHVPALALGGALQLRLGEAVAPTQQLGQMGPGLLRSLLLAPPPYAGWGSQTGALLHIKSGALLRCLAMVYRRCTEAGPMPGAVVPCERS